jgi:hypothetical protein
MSPLNRWAVGGRFLLSMCLVGAAVGCGELDATEEPFVGTVLYQDPDGAFSLRLLEPPWTPPFRVQGSTFSGVPPSDVTDFSDPLALLAKALYSLQIDPPGGTAPMAAMQAVKAGLPATAMAAEEPITTASGADGMVLAWQEAEEIFHRDAFVAASGTLTYRLHFTAKKAIGDDPMVGQMIASFAPR